MSKHHWYKARISWSAIEGEGTSSYRAYSRDHSITVDHKTIIEASSDPSFLGNPTLHNPEELFLASLSSCHMLWFLHLCSTNNVIILSYEDQAEGVMVEEKNGQGRFIEVTLNPKVTVKEERMASKVDSIHFKANQMCFIANSCNFPIKHVSEVEIKN